MDFRWLAQYSGRYNKIELMEARNNVFGATFWQKSQKVKLKR